MWTLVQVERPPLLAVVFIGSTGWTFLKRRPLSAISLGIPKAEGIDRNTRRGHRRHTLVTRWP